MGFRGRSLENDLRRQLHFAGVVDRRSDYTKVLAILAGIRNTPYWMVEAIDCVHPQLQLRRLKEWELPENRSIKVLVRLATQRVSRGVPECVLSRGNKGTGINPLTGCLMLRFGIAYLIRALIAGTYKVKV